MKKLLFLLVLVAFGRTGFSQTASADVAAFKWTSTVNDFGKIKQNVPATHEFKFTNTGKVDLVITNAQPSCGCTTPDWTKTPVPPGQTGFIKATYNAASPGIFDKTITVSANVEGGSVQLHIKGEVVPNVQ